MSMYDILPVTWSSKLKYPLTKIQEIILNNRIDKHLDKFLQGENEYDIRDINSSKESALLIKETIENNKKIMLVTDYDADGILSCSILYFGIKSIFNLDNDSLIAVINKREYSNGINERLTDMIKTYIERNEKFGLLVTADHGSANHEAYDILNNHFDNIIVTDHHQIPEDKGVLTNVKYFVNPQKDSNEIFKTLSGATVAASLVLNLLDIVKPDNYDTIKNHILTLAGISVLTDQMSLLTNINRNLVTFAVENINRDNHFVYKAMQLLVPGNRVDYENLSYVIGALINASSRQGDPYVAFKWLTIDNETLSNAKLLDLKIMNNERKKEQNSLVDQISKDGNIINMNNLIFIPIDRGHSINGIIAGVIGDRYKKPTLVAAKTGKYYYGSARGIIQGFDISKILTMMKDEGLLISAGGHAAAAGFKFEARKLEDVIRRLEEIDQTLDLDRTGIIDYDFEFKVFNQINNNYLYQQESLAPYGQGFRKPVITMELYLNRYRVLGNTEHVLVWLRDFKGNIRKFFFMNGKALILNNENKLKYNLTRYYFTVSREDGFITYKLVNIHL